MSKVQKRKIAAQLAALFHDHIIEKTYTMQHRGRKLRTALEDLTPNERRAFMRAAVTVYRLGADPKEFVTAQFQAWADYSQAFGKYILPHPSTLATLGGMARYAQFKKQQEERTQRKTPMKSGMLKEFYREDRKLNGMIKFMRLPETDILTQRPEEFSREYLKAKGIWSVVKDTWLERTGE